MLEIEIVEVNEIEGGVEVFSRAWKDGEQISFGDGTIDIERFRIFNPPVLVNDPDGDVIREYNEIQDDGTILVKTHTYREDPAEAVLTSIEHTISIKKEIGGSSNIVPGKRGKTTSTFYPAAGANEPVDGWVTKDGTGQSWSTIHDGAGNAHQDLDSSERMAYYRKDSGNWTTLFRSIFGYDTSSLGTDTISSATMSLYGSGTTNSATPSPAPGVTIDKHAGPASTSALANADYNIANWDSVDQSDTSITRASWSTSSYNDFPLNTTGISNINGSGLTWFGARWDSDIDDSEPTMGNGIHGCNGYYADQSGTTNDPKLVVEHSAAAATFIPKIIMS